MYGNKTEKYRTEYNAQRWASPTDLAGLLMLMTPQGWRVDFHKVDADKDSGWTMFTKTTADTLPLMEREIKLSNLFSILNSTEVYRAAEKGIENGYPTVCSKISELVQASVRMEGDVNG